MPKVDLTEVDVKNLMVIINSAQIKGESAEAIVILKRKLTALQKSDPTPTQQPQEEKKDGEIIDTSAAVSS